MKNQSLLLSFFILIVFSSMFYSCDRIVEDDTYIYNPKVLWENKMFESNDANASYVPICVEGDNIAVIYHTSNNYDYKLGVYKTADGGKHPAWTNGIDIDGTVSPISIVFGGDNKDVVIICTNSYIKAYSLDNQSLLWEKYWRTSLFREQCSFGNSYYIAYDSLTSSSVGDSSSIYAIDVHTGQIQNIISSEHITCFNPKVDIDNAGDTILYFLENYYSIAYNLTTNSIKWVSDYQDYPNGFIFKSYLSDNVFCSQSPIRIFGYDVETGALIMHKINGDASTTCLFTDDYTFTYIDNKYLNCHDISYSTRYWMRQFYQIKYRQVSTEMAYYNGMIYFISLENFEGNDTFNLRCVKAATGELLWTSRDVTTLYHPYVDQEKGILYTIDNDGLIAYDLNNSPVISVEN